MLNSTYHSGKRLLFRYFYKTAMSPNSFIAKKRTQLRNKQRLISEKRAGGNSYSRNSSESQGFAYHKYSFGYHVKEDLPADK
ncbi:hypothetical protein NC652_024271 [Populus alba x Populus x berolinensis]|nr:hypothetical protein NC652_024271 [Populus alba x Populus x berolinensis]